MYRVVTAVAALGVTLGFTGTALAQGYYSAPAYPAPNAGYYDAPPYTVPAPPSPAYTAPVWDGLHTSGSAARAYSYWGAQKSN